MAIRRKLKLLWRTQCACFYTKFMSTEGSPACMTYACSYSELQQWPPCKPPPLSTRTAFLPLRTSKWEQVCRCSHYNSSSSPSSLLIVLPCSFGATTSPARTPVKPKPKRCCIVSSSVPDTLALARFRGLPTVPLSNALLGPKSKAVLASSEGGVIARLDSCGGVDSPVGVFDAGDFLVAGVPALRGSAECCRFS